MDNFGEHCFGHYTVVGFVEGLFCTQTVHLGPGLHTTVGLSSRVAVNRVPLYYSIDMKFVYK